MSVMNIAIAGGVVLLALLLVKMRREKGGEQAPKGAKGRGRGRRKDRKAPPAPPEPMPLAAAADAVSPIDEPQAPRWPEELGEDEWPPAPAQEPVAAWPPPADEPADEAFAAEEPVAAHAPAPAPVAEEPVPAPSPAPRGRRTRS